MKKQLSLLLAAVMAAATLMGCSGNTSGNNSASTAGSSAATESTDASPDSSSQASSETSTATSELKGPGNVTLSFLGFSLDFDPNTDVMAGVIEDTTGYHAEYSMLPSDGADEKLIADVAGGVDYDILKVTVDQFQKLQAQGALQPLNDLLDSYGQDIVSGLADENMWTAFSDDDGNIYDIPFMNEYPRQIGFITCRKDLMEAAGITELPTTRDDFYNCLVTLKNYYGDDYIILSAANGWDAVCKCIAASFGIYNDWMVDENGQVFYMTEHENFDDYINFMKKLYDEGLLDSEFAVNTDDTVHEKLSSGRAIMGGSDHSAQIAISTSLIDNLGLSLDEIGYICPLEGPDGTCTILAGDSVNYVTCIPKSSENAADVINYINLKVQNQEYICIGEEGVHFEFDEAGNYIPIMPTFTDEKGNAWWYINATDTETYAKQWLARVRKSDYQWDAFEKTTIYTEENHPDIYVDNVFLYKPATGAYTENNTALKNDLFNYMIQVIVGTNDIDNGMTTFQNDWTAAGGEDVRTDLQTWYTGYYE